MYTKHLSKHSDNKGGHNLQACDLHEQHICLEEHACTWLWVHKCNTTSYGYIKLLHKHTSQFQDICVYNILRTLSSRIDVHVSLYKNPHTLTRYTSWQSHIQLSVWKDRLGEVDTYIRFGLPLRLVNCHRKTQSDGELLPLKLEWKSEVFGRRHWYPCYEHPLSCMLPINNLSINNYSGIPVPSAEFHCKDHYEDQDYKAI